jgi:hypothetical protein
MSDRDQYKAQEKDLHIGLRRYKRQSWVNRRDGKKRCLLTSDEARALRSEIRREGSNLLWISHALNRRAYGSLREKSSSIRALIRCGD